jgi:hypothetical protein
VSEPGAEITPEMADELVTEVIHFLQGKYPAIDTFTAMEALFRAWNEVDCVLIDLDNDPVTLERLKAWSQRKGCSIAQAAHHVLVAHAEDALPTEEEEAQFEASYAKATAAMEPQQSLEDLPLVPKKKWDANYGANAPSTFARATRFGGRWASFFSERPSTLTSSPTSDLRQNGQV